jgi:L-cysteine/cystine lyase
MVVETALEAKVEQLRAQLPAVQTTGYFNTGSNGPLPIVAVEAAAAALRRELERGRIVPGTYEANRERNRSVAALAGKIFGADADEMALTHSASEGLSTALMGMTWRPGDEIVSTTEEHPGLLLPLALLARRFAVITRYAEIGNGGQAVVEALASRITARTRAIALSHVLWSTGAVLPMLEICALARAHHLLVIVDGAQSAGQVPVDLHALGVDAYAMAGQKWLCGPESTGLLYVRRDRFPDIAPSYARYGQFDASGYYLPAAGAMRYEIGEFYSSAIAAQEAALRWLHEDVGLDWAYQRIARLGRDLRSQIAEADGLTTISPVEAMAGLVNFTIDGMRPQEIAAALYEQGHTIRFVDARPCTVSARASVGWWNTEAEVADLAAAIRELAESAARG